MWYLLDVKYIVIPPIYIFQMVEDGFVEPDGLFVVLKHWREPGSTPDKGMYNNVGVP